MGAVGWDYSDEPLRLIMVIIGGFYVETNWRLDLLGNKSGLCG